LVRYLSYIFYHYYILVIYNYINHNISYKIMKRFLLHLGLKYIVKKEI